MRLAEAKFLNSEESTRLEELLIAQLSGSKIDGNQLIDKLNELLPVKKLSPDTVKKRVEGYYYAAEMCWNKALEAGISRTDVVKIAKLKPLSHYHYLTGSRESKNAVLTRDDFLNDPATALVKLKDDIISILAILPKLKSA